MTSDDKLVRRVLARYVAAACHATMEHPTDKSRRDYLREHPGADPEKHEVGGRERKTKKSPWGPTGKKLQWQDAGSGSMWARFKTDDARQYSHRYRIQRRGTGEWLVQLETTDGLKTVDAARSPAMAKQLAQQHMEKLVESAG